MECVSQFSDYMASNCNAKIRYCANYIILNLHRNISYLTASGTCYRGVPSLPSQERMLHQAQQLNCNAVHILRCVVASATEAEVGAFFLSAIK